MQGLWRGLGLGLGKTKFVEDGGGEAEQKKEVRSWRIGKEAYEKKMVHHQGIKQLWESKWKFPVSYLKWKSTENGKSDGVAIVLDLGISIPRWKIRGF
jgi:hypothetical protein